MQATADTRESVPPNYLDPALWPDHLQLPFEDGIPIKNTLEHSQSVLLTDSFRPVARQQHPDDHYFIGQDCGIYWKPPDPKLYAVAPDWYFVPGVPPTFDGQPRRSYVLWHEGVAPWAILEFASGNGSEELDCTPMTGKFWIYEQRIQPEFYGIYFPFEGRTLAFRKVHRRFEAVSPNERGRYPVAGLGVELGLWRGRIDGVEMPWLRWWDDKGQLLLTGEERVALEQQANVRLRQQANEAQQRAALLAEKLRALGVNPDQM